MDPLGNGQNGVMRTTEFDAMWRGSSRSNSSDTLRGSDVEPVSSATADRDMDAVHATVRDMILRGDLSPGEPVSQIRLASLLGVSRTPLREALRRLQEEGLITSARNRRVVVAPFDAAALEYVFSRRIMMEGLGLALTVPLLDDQQLTELDELLHAMEANDDGWEASHGRFHQLLQSHAPENQRSDAERLHDWSDMYRKLYAAALSGGWGPHRRPAANAEHRSIFVACVNRDTELAVARLGWHLGRTALTLLAQLAPQHDPVVIRKALDMVAGSRADAAFELLRTLPRA
jgi:DNA-binding GntR family transcriptional regulator